MRVVPCACVFGALSLVACEALTGPPFPTDAVRYKPLEVYAEWWRVVEACSGTHGSLGAVRWYRASQSSIALSTERDAVASWTPNGNRIVVSSDLIGTGGVVRHEMLHALLRRGGHPSEYFLRRCSGVVPCYEECVADAGGQPPLPPFARRVPPESLEVVGVISPPSPGGSIWGGYIMFTVQVRNPYSEPIVVALPPSGDYGPPITFSYAATRGGETQWRDMRADASGDTIFAPYERKLHVFDFGVGGRQGAFWIGPGDWVFQGSFGKHSGAEVAVRIAP